MTDTTTSSCPFWCESDHPAGGVHRRVAGETTIGGKTVLVVLQQMPGGDATIAISGAVYVAVGDVSHDGAAALMELCGQPVLAGMIRDAAGLLAAVEGQSTALASSVPGTWPGGEPQSVRDAADPVTIVRQPVPGWYAPPANGDDDGEAYVLDVAHLLDQRGYSVGGYDFDRHGDQPSALVTLPGVTAYGIALVWEKGVGWTVGYPHYPGHDGMACMRRLAALGERPSPDVLAALVGRISVARTTEGEGEAR